MIQSFTNCEKNKVKKNIAIKTNQLSQKQSKSVQRSVFEENKTNNKFQEIQIFSNQQTKRFATVIKNQMRKDQNEPSSVLQRFNEEKMRKKINQSERNSEKINHNSFSKFPPTFTQLLPILLIILMVIELIIISLQYMQNFQTYIICGIMTFLLLITAYFWFQASVISPTDSVQLQHLQFIRNPENSSFYLQNQKYFCNLCQTFIQQKSFHCNKCNRCVEQFDHHCKWLNNCIGAKNYSSFIKLIVWCQLLMIFFFVSNVFLICKIVNQNDKLPGILWFAVIVIILWIVPFIALSMLLFLHLYLIIIKKKTFQLFFEKIKQKQFFFQNSNQNLALKKKKGEFLVEQSRINSLNSFTLSSVRKDIDKENNQKLLKFVRNLSNTLKQEKEESKIETIKVKKVPFKMRQLQNKQNFSDFTPKQSPNKNDEIRHISQTQGAKNQFFGQKFQEIKEPFKYQTENTIKIDKQLGEINKNTSNINDFSCDKSQQKQKNHEIKSKAQNQNKIA